MNEHEMRDYPRDRDERADYPIDPEDITKDMLTLMYLQERTGHRMSQILRKISSDPDLTGPVDKLWKLIELGRLAEEFLEYGRDITKAVHEGYYKEKS